MIERGKWQFKYFVGRVKTLFQKDLLTVKNGPLPIEAGNVGIDPYDVSLNLYLVLSEMGYPLEIRKGARNVLGRPIIGGMMRILVDSQTTRDKIGAFFGRPSNLNPAPQEGSGFYSPDTSIFSYDTTHIVEASGYGGTRILRALYEGNERPFYESPNNTLIRFKTPEDDVKKMLIQRCFMRAHEVALRMNKTMLAPIDLKRQEFEDEMRNQPLYETLKVPGIRPIAPSEVKEVVRADVRDILLRNPQLLP